MADEVTQGNKNPLEVYVELKKIEKTLEMCLESVKPLAIREADTYTEKSFERFGVTITKSRAAGRWDYKGIDQWKKQNDKLLDIQKMAQDAFKLSEKGQTITDPDGVVVEAAKYTEGADIIVIKQPKI
jgi:hypothetical protein